MITTGKQQTTNRTWLIATSMNMRGIKISTLSRNYELKKKHCLKNTYK
jgi:hypothetical protein